MSNKLRDINTWNCALVVDVFEDGNTLVRDVILKHVDEKDVIFVGPVEHKPNIYQITFRAMQEQYVLDDIRNELNVLQKQLRYAVELSQGKSGRYEPFRTWENS